MKKLSVIFFGTHHFAATILAGLLESPLISVALVITRPDQPAGRGRQTKKPAVKILAEKYQLKIDQPPTLKSYPLSRFSFTRKSRILDSAAAESGPPKIYDLGLVAQYGLLIPGRIINAPESGTLNVHTSLLPKYRGASPGQCALINGESETGVTIMKMDEGLDTGPILSQAKLKIAPDDTYPDLEEKLARLGLSALLKTVPPYCRGELGGLAQTENEATYCCMLTRADGRIDWSKNTEEIYNLYRGLTPWPGIWTMWGNARLKLVKIKPHDKTIAAGKVLIANKQLLIGTKNKSIEILELQLEGKKSMDAQTFINGHKQINGVILK